MSLFKRKMKVYGEESNYGGYVILQNKKGKKSKHYISSVDQNYSHKDNEVSIWVRGKKGDEVIRYEVGTNSAVDTAIRTWTSNRRKAGMRVQDDLPSKCYRK